MRSIAEDRPRTFRKSSGRMWRTKRTIDLASGITLLNLGNARDTVV